MASIFEGPLRDEARISGIEFRFERCFRELSGGKAVVRTAE